MTPLRLSPVETGPLDRNGRPEGRSLSALLAQLGADDPEQRRRAVLDLTEHPEALPALLDRIGRETDRTVRDAICTQLARHDLPLVVDSLVVHLASDDAGLRNAVAEVLARTPKAIAPWVPRLLADPDPDVRIITVMVLSTLRSSAVEGWLTELVRTDVHPNVVAAAIGELTPIAGTRCEPALRAARERFSDDPFIAFAVTRALDSLDKDRQ